MKHLFTKTAISMVTTTGLVLAIAITANDLAYAAELNFKNRDAAGTKQILDLSNNSVQVSKVPEGSIIIGLLAVCSLGFSLKQKKASTAWRKSSYYHN
ncbi:PEP-CTERM sorting domain-containing protein [Nostoc sp.]|uniref:PEP-CTERM sorting domain-containing protein n=1 Tax=Nostoc sp. TaxID=1180 RepID=UPI002FF84455